MRRRGVAVVESERKERWTEQRARKLRFWCVSQACQKSRILIISFLHHIEGGTIAKGNEQGQRWTWIKRGGKEWVRRDWERGRWCVGPLPAAKTSCQQNLDSKRLRILAQRFMSLSINEKTNDTYVLFASVGNHHLNTMRRGKLLCLTKKSKFLRRNLPAFHCVLQIYLTHNYLFVLQLTFFCNKQNFGSFKCQQ